MACITPFSVTIKTTNQKVPVPCGKCPDCKGRKTSGWSFRLMQQDRIAMSSQFVTLTYDTDHVPITRNGFMSLQKRDLQLFFKRLRKLQSADPASASMPGIKYYAVGEYGGKTNRPHYHIILFNAILDLIPRAWQLGTIHYGKVSGASVGYTLKYMMKEGKIPMHRNDDRMKEFSLMSKGLGENYLSENMVKWHHDDLDNRMYVTTDQGQKVSMPRYYKQKVYTEMERKRIAYFAVKKAIEKQLDHERNMREIHGDRAPEVQAEIHKQKFKKMYSDAKKNRDKI